MSLWIFDSRANTTEIEAGVRAARAYFDRIGWRPGIIAAVIRADKGTPATELAQRYWDEAEAEAFKAAFGDWSNWPEAAMLVWEDRP